LDLLAQGEACVSELVAATGASFSTVSQRLRVLRTEGVVSARREGKHVFYRLADAHIESLVHNALEHALEHKSPHVTKGEEHEQA
jgi:DNA-binding transcriptional ArsR family regulator